MLNGALAGVLSTGEFLAVAGVVFVLGLGVGSFLNVVILRYGQDRVTTGRSACPKCKRILSAGDLIPVLSFVFLLGKCRGCKLPISWQYPVVEILTGLIFVLTFLHRVTAYPITEPVELLSVGFLGSVVILFVIWSLLIVITVYDLYHKIIPDPLVWSFVALAGVWLVVDRYISGVDWSMALVLDLLTGPLLFGLFYLPWRFSGGRWMGLGDAKLVLGVGLFLGFAHGFSAIILAFWIGAAVALILIGLLKISAVYGTDKFRHVLGHISLKSEMPFGPFLVLGTLLSFFLEFDILSLSYWI